VKYVVGTVFALLIIVGMIGRSETVGALSWVVVTIGLDIYWQWIRWQRLQLVKASMVLGRVVGGFLIRVLSILTILWLVHSWLHPRVFYIYSLLLLTLPIWNIIAALFWERKIKSW